VFAFPLGGYAGQSYPIPNHEKASLANSKPKIWTGNSEPLVRSGSLQLCGAQTRISELGLSKFPYSEIRRAKIGFLFGLFVDAFKVGS
jgi:hypothetical protein